jgi:hypothetical protein
MWRTSLQWVAGITVLVVVSGGLAQSWAGEALVAWDPTTTDINGNLVTTLVSYHLYWKDNAVGAVIQDRDVGSQTTYLLTGLTGGRTYTLWVTASDTTGNVSGPSDTLLISVPLALADAASTLAGTAVSITVLANDSGSSLRITTVTQGANGTVTIQGPTTVIYTPAAGFVGTDGFTYTITNSQGVSATATVTVTVTSPPPLAIADAAVTPAGTPVTLDVLVNDSDPLGYYPLRITAVTPGANGTVTYVPGAPTVTYTPKAGFVGTDGFTYSITNSQGVSATATVTVTVTSPPPLAIADAAATPAGIPVTLTVLANDSGSSLSITAVTPGANGTVTKGAGTVTYTPQAGFVGMDSFTYTITNSQGVSTTATVTITVFAQLEAEAGALQAPMQVGTETATPPVQYVWVPSGTPSIWDPIQAGGASRYTFMVSQTDGYVVWGSVSPSTTGTGSFFLGLDTPTVATISPTTSQVDTLHVGSRCYIDTTATIKALPPGLDGIVIIKTADAAKRNKQATFLTFTLLQDARLYVAYDARVSAPSWLGPPSFTNTGQRIETTYGPMALWKRDVSAGPVSLPGNKYQAPGPGRSQYLVLLATPYLVWDVTPPPTAGTAPQAWRWDQAAMDTTPVFWLDAGSHTLTIRQRQSGTRLDKLMITNNLDLVPQD